MAWWHDAAWCWPGMALHEIIVWNAMQHAVGYHDLNCQGMSQIFMAWCSLAWHGMARRGTARHGVARHGIEWHGPTWHGIASHRMVDMLNVGNA
jgi:hypothetical protein